MWHRPILVGVVCVIVLLGCRSAPSDEESVIKDSVAGIVPLGLKSGRDSFCPVETYRSREDQLCGPKKYVKKRSAACGPELFHLRPSLSCPGSIAVDSYQQEASSCGSAPAIDCRAGYVKTSDAVSVTGACPPRAENDRLTRSVTCTRPEVAASCRLSEFGVERYKSCEHRSHGVAQYKTCEHQAFGPATYKVCSYYLTQGELGGYLREVRSLLPFMAETLINSRGHYFGYVNDEAGLACHIERYARDPLFDEQIADLKSLYLTRFGRTWTSGQISCGGGEPVDVSEVACPDSDMSRACAAARTYRGAAKWIQVKLLDLTNLVDDIVAKRDAAVRREIEHLKTKTTTYQIKP